MILHCPKFKPSHNLVLFIFWLSGNWLQWEVSPVPNKILHEMSWKLTIFVHVVHIIYIWLKEDFILFLQFRLCHPFVLFLLYEKRVERLQWEDSQFRNKILYIDFITRRLWASNDKILYIDSESATSCHFQFSRFGFQMTWK